MFENLSEKLQRVFKNLRGEGKLTAENMETALREIRVALLEADVHFRVVKQLIENIKEKAMGQEVSPRFRPASRSSRSFTTSWSGSSARIRPSCVSPTSRPSVIMIVGLQGSGKTTSTGKLARWLSKNGHSPADGVGGRLPSRGAQAVERHRARREAADLRGHAGGDVKPVELARSARREAVQTGRDTLLVDTAGRLHIDEELMAELQQLKELLNPTEILFVADAMTGQDAVKSAEEFHKRLGITGVILTKMDGDARGGAALSIRTVTDQPLKFVGVGEKFDALEPFHPDRVAIANPRHGRRAVADRKGRAEHRSEKSRGDAAEADRQRVHARRFPRSAAADPQARPARIAARHDAAGRSVQRAEERQGRRERDHARGRDHRLDDAAGAAQPHDHQRSRRRRIARGSGTTVQEVNQLLKQYAQARKMMKTFSGGLLGARSCRAWAISSCRICLAAESQIR